MTRHCADINTLVAEYLRKSSFSLSLEKSPKGLRTLGIMGRENAVLLSRDREGAGNDSVAIILRGRSIEGGLGVRNITIHLTEFITDTYL